MCALLNSLQLFPLGDMMISPHISSACLSHVERTIHNGSGEIYYFRNSYVLRVLIKNNQQFILLAPGEVSCLCPQSTQQILTVPSSVAGTYTQQHRGTRHVKLFPNITRNENSSGSACCHQPCIFQPARMGSHVGQEPD